MAERDTGKDMDTMENMDTQIKDNNLKTKRHAAYEPFNMLEIFATRKRSKCIRFLYLSCVTLKQV